jgi:hypothetical protein
MPLPESPRTIKWRKGEIIGAGAYGRVYMGMNLDSGELLAVKQVSPPLGNLKFSTIRMSFDRGTSLVYSLKRSDVNWPNLNLCKVMVSLFQTRDQKFPEGDGLLLYK